MCKENPSWCALCNEKDHTWNKITNTKAFLVPGIGLQSWKGQMEVVKYEAHDVGLGVEVLQSGFYMTKMLVV